MRFEWDENKNRQNLLKHGVGFETATLVFEDPHALTDVDLSSEDERWDTLGKVSASLVLFVVHTWLEQNGEDVIRIISARAAESHERRIYEEAQQGAKARYRYPRRKKGRGH